MNFVDKLKQDMINAMKAKDKERLTVIRMVKAALDKERIDKKAEVNDELLIDVVNKQVKMRNDSIDEFKKANRDDLIKQAEYELSILKEYLPEQLTLDEIKKLVSEAIEKTGAASPRDMGKVMQEIRSKIAGKADGKVVSDMVKQMLA